MSNLVDPTLVSPSRLSTYSKCGLRFEFQYVHGMKPNQATGAQLYGTIVHKARERWVKDRKRLHLAVLMEEAWDEIGREDAAIGLWLREYRSLRERARDVVAEIRARRPDIKSPKLTKDWKESDVAKELAELQQYAMDEHGRESRYQFSKSDKIGDLYEESLEMAVSYQARWRHLPDALYTELGFKADWRGFKLNGHIDSIVHIIDQSSGAWLGYGIEDCKTAREPGLSQKHLNQLGIYHVGLEALKERGVVDLDPNAPVFVGIDYWRLLDQHWYSINDLQLKRLEHDLTTYRRAVAERIFLAAASGQECKLCDFAAECSDYHGPARAHDIEEALGLVAA